MDNQGQIFATDNRQAPPCPIHDRIERAGARNIQVITQRTGQGNAGRSCRHGDLVLIDAPCTGTGAMAAQSGMPNGACVRRARRAAEGSAEALDHAATLVKPGGRIAYITCSGARRRERRAGAQLRGSSSEFAVDASSEVTTALGERGFLFRASC